MAARLGRWPSSTADCFSMFRSSSVMRKPDIPKDRRKSFRSAIGVLQQILLQGLEDGIEHSGVAGRWEVQVDRVAQIHAESALEPVRPRRYRLVFLLLRGHARLVHLILGG